MMKKKRVDCQSTLFLLFVCLSIPGGAMPSPEHNRLASTRGDYRPLPLTGQRK